MAYTNAWSVTVPAGSELANTIDDHLRRLRLDIEERMNDIVADWAADPVVLNASTLPITQKGVQYDADASPGSRASSYTNLAKSLALHFSGTTDANGVIVIDLDEINTAFESADFYNVAALVGVAVQHNAVGSPRDVRVLNVNTVSNTISLVFHDETDLGAGTGVDSPTPLNVIENAWLTLHFYG